jgi:S1-C subfamily serine protease
VPIVDVVLIVLLVLGALEGLRVGAVVQLFTFGAFWLGLTLGALLAAAVVPMLSSPAAKAALTLVAVLGLALFLGAMGRIAGSWSSRAIRRHHLGVIDSAMGAMVAVLAVLLSAWLIASLLSQSRFSSVGSAVQHSAILRTVDDVLPPLPSVFSRVQAFLQSEGFPTAFAELAPPSSSPVATPSTAQAQAIASGVESSTAKVLGAACGQEQEGSAFVVGPGLVATNAHVIAGERSTEVVVDGASYHATPVYFDPNYDLAVLRTSAPLGPPLSLDSGSVPRGTLAAVVGYPENGPLTVSPAGVAGSLDAAGRNIYNDGVVVREIYQIDADVEPGNSGSPLVTGGGTVIGVVFSRSTTMSGVGYALTSPGVLSRVHQAEGRTAAVSTGACVDG